MSAEGHKALHNTQMLSRRNKDRRTIRLLSTLRFISIAFITLLLPTACGYFSSGKWEDDPQNWKRAWAYSKPDDVIMPHSWYWRSPHWTREEAYFFQFRWHEELFNQFVANDNMSPVESREAKPEYCFEKPRWFVPKETSAYEIWRNGASGQSWLFRDANTNELFLYACQL